jgi:argonaute-like protein implicated in RNA metabolism and viral defense
LFSLLHFQIIIDIAFFVTIILLLRQLNKRIAKDPPAVDISIVHEYKKLMTDSQDLTNHFIQTVEESERKLNKLDCQLDNKEKRLIILIEEVEGLIKKVDSRQTQKEPIYSDAEKYDRIIKMIQEGQSREGVAKRIGVTEGEIDLVMELEQTRMNNL